VLAAEPASPALSLRWSDPGGLAATSAEDFASRLSERLGRTAFDPAQAARALSVTWQGSPEQCRIQLSLVKSGEIQGTRQLESPSGDCPSLVPALLTVAALLLEAQRAEPEPVDEPAPAPAPAVAPSPAPTAPVAPVSTKNPSLLVSLGGALSSGFAPKLELGPAAAVVGAPYPQLRVGADGALLLPHQYGAGPGFELGHHRIGLLACGMPLHQSFALGVCASAALHLFSSRGISLPHSEQHHESSISVGANLRAEWQLTEHLWWVGHAGADVNTRPLYFYYSTAPGGQLTLFRQRSVSPMLLLGLTLALP
jgi:hypothetical protein